MGGSIDWCSIRGAETRAVAEGDLVSAEAGGLPIYRVLTLNAGRAWVRDLDGGADRLIPLSEFHWQAVSPT